MFVDKVSRCKDLDWSLLHTRSKGGPLTSEERTLNVGEEAGNKKWENRLS